MQNSQFWGKNDALPSFALYFTVTTFWNVLELNKKKGSEPLPIQINQDSVSVTNLHWSFWPLSVISFFSSLPNINLLVSSYKVFYSHMYYIFARKKWGKKSFQTKDHKTIMYLQDAHNVCSSIRSKIICKL
jgi:hypothetical protein